MKQTCGCVGGQDVRSSMSFYNCTECRALSGECPPAQVSLLIPAGPWKGESKHCEQNATWDGTGQAQESQRQVAMSFQPVQLAQLWGCAEAMWLC